MGHTRTLQEKQDDSVSWQYKESKTNHVVLGDLRKGTQYEVQVRARTTAGYSNFSPSSIFRTLPDGKESPRLPSRPTPSDCHVEPFVSVIILFLLLLSFFFLLQETSPTPTLWLLGSWWLLPH